MSFLKKLFKRGKKPEPTGGKGMGTKDAEPEPTGGKGMGTKDTGSEIE